MWFGKHREVADVVTIALQNHEGQTTTSAIAGSFSRSDNHVAFQVGREPYSPSCRQLPSINVVTQHTFTGLRLSVPTAFGVVATSWPFARISIGEDGVDLISTFPLRSEWCASLDEITSVKTDGQRVRFGRRDGSIACFRHFSWSHDGLVSALVGCGLRVEHVDEVE